MKTSNLKNVLSLGMVVAMLLTVSVSFANTGSKAEEKAREAVENAAPDDWHTLAESAEKLMRNKKNLKEANEWIDRSIEIKETTYNHTLKGDYFVAVKMPDKALDYYVKAMQLAREEDKNAELSSLQQKVAAITGIGG